MTRQIDPKMLQKMSHQPKVKRPDAQLPKAVLDVSQAKYIANPKTEEEVTQYLHWRLKEALARSPLKQSRVVRVDHINPYLESVGPARMDVIIAGYDEEGVPRKLELIVFPECYIPVTCKKCKNISLLGAEFFCNHCFSDLHVMLHGMPFTFAGGNYIGYNKDGWKAIWVEPASLTANPRFKLMEPAAQVPSPADYISLPNPGRMDLDNRVSANMNSGGAHISRGLQGSMSPSSSDTSPSTNPTEIDAPGSPEGLKSGV